MKGLAEVLAEGIHRADDSIDMRYATHVAESIQPAVLDWARERLAGAREDVAGRLREEGLMWATHTDRWGDRDWQQRLSLELADAALAAVAEALGVGEVRADGESSAGRISARDELNLHLLATQGRVLGEKPWTTNEQGGQA